jgi:hypothetical protein
MGSKASLRFSPLTGLGRSGTLHCHGQRPERDVARSLGTER